MALQVVQRTEFHTQAAQKDGVHLESCYSDAESKSVSSHIQSKDMAWIILP